jgi:hypothetical protein
MTGAVRTSNPTHSSGYCTPTCPKSSEGPSFIDILMIILFCLLLVTLLFDSLNESVDPALQENYQAVQMF